MDRRRIAAALFVGRLVGSLVVLLVPVPAQALINDKFTPVDLHDQSATVLKVTLKATDKPLVFDIQIREAYKKEKGQKPNLKFDLSTGPFVKEQGDTIAKEIKDRGSEFFLLFAGEFHERAEGGEGGGQQLAEGYLHMGGRWISLFKMKDGGGYEMNKIDDYMNGTWAGSTDMLDNCLKYIRVRQSAGSDPIVPVRAEASWDRNAKIGNVPGKVTSAIPVDMGEVEYLFIGSDAGDKLFAFDPGQPKGGEMMDVTAKVKLASKSLAAVWGDFDRNGKVDLASWDGKALTLHLQQADGTFLAKPIDTGEALKSGVVNLSVIDCGKPMPGLLAGTKAGPVLLAPAGDGKFAGTLLPGAASFAPTTQKDRTESAGQCLVADLDNDGLADVLQLFNTYSVIYKGTALGEFAKGERNNVCLGQGRSKAWLGDYKGDGTLDIFCVAEDVCRLWQNMGGLKFIDLYGASGEITYIAQAGGIDGGTCDFNNDGRPDILLIYGGVESQTCPQLFFNRGWRSTGHAHQPIDINELSVLPEAKDGQQAGCMGDFLGNGAQDMAFVLKNGDLYVFYRKVIEGDPALNVRACLPTKSGPVGPITVVGYQDKQCLGAWTVTAGSANGFFGVRSQGVRHFEWKTPDGKSHQKDVTVRDEAVKMMMDDNGKK